MCIYMNAKGKSSFNNCSRIRTRALCFGSLLQAHLGHIDDNHNIPCTDHHPLSGFHWNKGKENGFGRY